MKRHLIALISGAALAAAATLAACGGGGSGSSPTPPSLGSTTNTGSNIQATANGLKMVLTIDRAKAARPAKNVARRNAKSLRQPQYVSYATQTTGGLQIAVTAMVAGTPITKTIYADISDTSPLCTENVTTDVVTCTLTIPTLAASETIAATEVDTAPTSEGTNGNLPGYGSGFPAASNVVGATTSTVSTTPGTTSSINFGIDPVLANLYDCGFAFTVIPAAPTAYNASYDGSTNPARIVVTAGVAQTTVSQQVIEDIDTDCTYFPTPPSPQPSTLPLADVNGSPKPWTYTSSSQHVLIALANPTAAAPPAPSAFSASASITDTSLFSGYDFVQYLLEIDSGFNAPATITENNNLSATTPFTSHASPYTFTNTINVVPVSVTPTTATVTVTGDIPATVTGSDYLATSGMGAWAAVDVNGNPANQGNCIAPGGTTLATVALGAIDTTTWQQTATITPVMAGNCTFVLDDNDTHVVTPTISVTVNP